MLVLTCERGTLIEIGSDVTVRVVAIGIDAVELEIDAPSDVRLEPDLVFIESKSRRGAHVGSFT